MQERALVLLSGGIDSAVALWWASKQAYSVLPVTFHYHLRPKAEVTATRRLASRLGLDRMVERDLPFLKEVADLKNEGALRNETLTQSPEGYVPGRNLVFYALAANIAEVERAAWVIGGHNDGDRAVFPDAAPGFFGLINALYRSGLWSYAQSPVQVLQPLGAMGKAAVVRLGLDLGVPFEETWSCYTDGPEPCGKCASCHERREAFTAIGAEDPQRVLGSENTAVVK